MMFRVKIVLMILVAVRPMIATAKNTGMKCYKCKMNPKYLGNNVWDSNFCRRFEQTPAYEEYCEWSTYCMKKIYHYTHNGTMHTAVGERGCAYQLHSYHHLDKSINKWVKKQEVLDLYEEGCSDSVDRAEQVGRRTELCYCKSDLCNSGVLIELHNIIHALVVMRILSII